MSPVPFSAIKSSVFWLPIFSRLFSFAAGRFSLCAGEIQFVSGWLTSENAAWVAAYASSRGGFVVGAGMVKSVSEAGCKIQQFSGRLEIMAAVP